MMMMMMMINYWWCRSVGRREKTAQRLVRQLRQRSTTSSRPDTSRGNRSWIRSQSPQESRTCYLNY